MIEETKSNSIEETVKTKNTMDFTRLMSGKPYAALDLPGTTSYTYTKAQIQTALDSKDVVTLRKLSQKFFHTSGEYRRLVYYFGNMLTNDYIVVPKVEKSDFTTPSFKKAFNNILKYTEDAAIQETCGQIGVILVRDGAFFGYERQLDENSISLQQLPTIYCRSRYKVNGIYAVEFDFSFFNQYYKEEDLREILDAFPEEFQGKYQLYLQDRYNNQWQMINPLYARAHMLEDSIPMLSSIFEDILELENYKAMDRTRSALNIYKLIVQKLPVDKDGEISLLMEEVLALHNNARSMIRNSAIDVITTPCDMQAVALDDSSKYMVDDIEKGTNVLYNGAGTPIALFNTGNKTGSIGLKYSIQVDEALMLPILKQYEKWYKNRFDMISSKFEFSIIFPPNTRYNKEDQFAQYKDAAALGFPTKLLALATLGIKQTDADFLLNYENLILELPERMIPTTSSFNTSDPTGSPGGRPEKAKPLTPEGQKTKDTEANKNRA